MCIRDREYRAFVKQQLFDGRHGGALNHAKDMILGQLADAAEGEIPSILVENAYQQQMQVIQQQLQICLLYTSPRRSLATARTL